MAVSAMVNHAISREYLIRLYMIIREALRHPSGAANSENCLALGSLTMLALKGFTKPRK
jgi:hypothetical protein